MCIRDRAIYDEAIEINPNFANAYHERGRIKLLKGEDVYKRQLQGNYYPDENFSFFNILYLLAVQQCLPLCKFLIYRCLLVFGKKDTNLSASLLVKSPTKRKVIIYPSMMCIRDSYCSDHTRTVPVGGKFEGRQKDVYNIVLACHDKACLLYTSRCV